MHMEDFHCDMFNLSFNFTSEDFDKSAFLKEVGIENESEYVDEDGDLMFRLFLPSKEDMSKQHSHLTVLIRSDMTGRVSLDFHKPGSKQVENKPPYLEEATLWLSAFFKKSEVVARMDIAYEFGNDFETVIPMPFPLLASSKALSGLKVTGLSFEFPPDNPVRSAILQKETDKRYVFIQVRNSVNLKTFDLYQELGKFKGTVESLVRKQDSDDSNNQETKKT